MSRPTFFPHEREKTVFLIAPSCALPPGAPLFSFRKLFSPLSSGLSPFHLASIGRRLVES